MHQVSSLSLSLLIIMAVNNMRFEVLFTLKNWNMYCKARESCANSFKFRVFFLFMKIKLIINVEITGISESTVDNDK